MWHAPVRLGSFSEFPGSLSEISIETPHDVRFMTGMY